jgi:hypothetical protein
MCPNYLPDATFVLVLSKFYVMGVVLEVVTFGAWERSRSRDVNLFFLDV